LAKRVEDEVQLVLRDADPRIAHTKLQRDAVVVQREQARAQRNVALARRLGRRELDRIPDQIRDYLPQTERVADQLIRDVRVDVVRQVEVVLRRAHDERLQDPEHGLPERVRHSFHRHPPGLNCWTVRQFRRGKKRSSKRRTLGNIQDVINDQQQRARQTMNQQQALPLAPVQVAVQRKLCHANDPIHRRPQKKRKRESQPQTSQT
jgi:hypothetical protein